MRLRPFRFFFETDRASIWSEFDHAVPFRVAHLVSEDAGAVFKTESIPKEIELTVKDVVSQDETGARVANELFADQEGLGNSVWLRLFGIIDSDSKLGPVAEVIAQHWAIFRGRNNQHLPQSPEHEGRERVANHRFVVHR